MKPPKATRLPSGAWHVRVRVNGQDYSITRDTEKEALAEAMALKAGLKQEAKATGKNKTLTKAIDDYIEARSNVLSPATIRGYRMIQQAHFGPLMHKRLGVITPSQWQSQINLEARSYSAKTLKNAWGFIKAVIREETGQTPAVRLPQVIPNEKEFLDPDQIQVFLKAVKGHKVEVAALLALSSLRRSELIALDWSAVDLERGVIRVEAATVRGETAMIRKAETKNRSSRRTVPIIEPLRQALERVEVKEGLVVPNCHSWMAENINKVCRAAGLPEVGVHGLRHSFASLSYFLGAPEKVTMEIGGWSDDRTMHRIYTHVAEKARHDYGEKFTAFFQSIGAENDNEIDNND